MHSLFKRIFSLAVKPGIRENSWCTIPIPAANASKGDLKLVSTPSKIIFPPYPPVSEITGIPKIAFIKVDFPAPFSPTSPIISPFLISILISFKTKFSPKDFERFSILSNN